jgi:hypothetical protein
MFLPLASCRSFSTFLLASTALLIGCAQTTTSIENTSSGGSPGSSEGGTVGKGGSATGVGGAALGGAPSGGAASGGAASGGEGAGGAASGGKGTGGAASGGRASGGAAAGGAPSGGSGTGGSDALGGASETGGADVGGNGSGGLEQVGGNEGLGGNLGDGGTANLGGSTDSVGGAPDGLGGDTAAGGDSGVGGAVALTCESGAMDGDETGVDCGGSCAPGSRCKVGDGCTVGADCLSSTCIALVCETPTLSVKYGGCINGTTTCPTTSNAITASIEIFNNQTTPADVTDLEIRYYFTDEATEADTVEIDHDELKSSTGLAVTTTVVAVTTPVVGVDHYISLVYPAGTIAPNTGATISFRLHTVDYQGILDPSNDYSFNPSPAPVSSGTITLYRGGELIWGTEP